MSAKAHYPYMITALAITIHHSDGKNPIEKSFEKVNKKLKMI